MTATYLEPQAQALLARLDHRSAPMWELPIDELRADHKRVHAELNPEPAPVARHEEIVGGAVRCEVHVPTTEIGPLPVTLYLHGGGCVLLDPEAYRPLCSHLAVQSRSIVVCPDYRLAPEAPFPAAIDDAFATYRWAQQRAADIGGDGRRIAVCGDSAGGYLAAAVALAARDAGLAQPRGQVLVYPNTDMAGDWPSYHRPEFAELFANMAWLKGLYVGVDGADPRASPLRAADHRGLAPALVITAEYDPLVDEGRAYAERLAGAGVEVTHVLYHGAPHGFLSMGRWLATARAARSHVAATLAHWLSDASA